MSDARERSGIGRSSRAAILALAAVAPAALADCRRTVTMYGGPPNPLPTASVASATEDAGPAPTVSAAPQPAPETPDASLAPEPTHTVAAPMYGMPPPHPTSAHITAYGGPPALRPTIAPPVPKK